MRELYQLLTDKSDLLVWSTESAQLSSTLLKTDNERRSSSVPDLVIFQRTTAANFRLCSRCDVAVQNVYDQNQISLSRKNSRALL